MRKIKLKEGEFIRIRGIVTVYSPGKKRKCGWVGGSEWTLKNPLIRLGRCKHKPVKVAYFNNIFGKRIYTKGHLECKKCGYVIKLGKDEWK